MQRFGTDVDAADCPFCGCPVLLPSVGDLACWSCASCGALGRRVDPRPAAAQRAVSG
jgi:hypothetical protein